MVCHRQITTTSDRCCGSWVQKSNQTLERWKIINLQPGNLSIFSAKHLLYLCIVESILPDSTPPSLSGCGPAQYFSPLLNSEVLEARTYDRERCGNQSREPRREYESTSQKVRDIGCRDKALVRTSLRIHQILEPHCN